MILKIEGVFEKKNNIFSKKTGQKGYEYTYQKGPQQMQNFLNEEEVKFFLRLYYISLWFENDGQKYSF